MLTTTRTSGIVMLTLSLCTAGWDAGTAVAKVPRAFSSPVAKDAQDERLRLVGTWDLVEFSRQAVDGTVTTAWGRHPAGRITYDSGGHMTALLMHERRNEANGDRSDAEVQTEFSAYFGTYVVDTSAHVITHYVKGSLSAERASGELRRTYAFKDGALILTFTRPADGAKNTLVWRRAA